MTEKEKKCLEIIEPHMDKIIHFHKNRTLRGSIEFRKVLSEAIYELHGNKIEKAKINNGSCSSCSTRAFNVIYTLYVRQQEANRVDEPTSGQDGDKAVQPTAKKRRGRPRKKK